MNFAKFSEFNDFSEFYGGDKKKSFRKFFWKWIFKLHPLTNPLFIVDILIWKPVDMQKICSKSFSMAIMVTARHFFNHDKWNIFAVVFFEQKKATPECFFCFIINFLTSCCLRKTILNGFLFIFTSSNIHEFMNSFIYPPVPLFTWNNPFQSS